MRYQLGLSTVPQGAKVFRVFWLRAKGFLHAGKRRPIIFQYPPTQNPKISTRPFITQTAPTDVIMYMMVVKDVPE